MNLASDACKGLKTIKIHRPDPKQSPSFPCTKKGILCFLPGGLLRIPPVRARASIVDCPVRGTNRHLNNSGAPLTLGT